MSEPSVHDNRVLGYVVDAERRRIALHTVYERSDPPEHTDIVFEEVLAYRFEDDNFENILFGVDKVELDSLLSREAACFERGRRYCWPGPWNESLETARAFLRGRGARAFQISASYGLGGWVIASSCRFESVSRG